MLKPRGASKAGESGSLPLPLTEVFNRLDIQKHAESGPRGSSVSREHSVGWDFLRVPAPFGGDVFVGPPTTFDWPRWVNLLLTLRTPRVPGDFSRFWGKTIWLWVENWSPCCEPWKMKPKTKNLRSGLILTHPFGSGSKLKSQGYAACGLCFHIPLFHFVPFGASQRLHLQSLGLILNQEPFGARPNDRPGLRSRWAARAQLLHALDELLGPKEPSGAQRQKETEGRFQKNVRGRLFEEGKGFCKGLAGVGLGFRGVFFLIFFFPPVGLELV